MDSGTGDGYDFSLYSKMQREAMARHSGKNSDIIETADLLYIF